MRERRQAYSSSGVTKKRVVFSSSFLQYDMVYVSRCASICAVYEKGRPCNLRTPLDCTRRKVGFGRSRSFCVVLIVCASSPLMTITWWLHSDQNLRLGPKGRSGKQDNGGEYAVRYGRSERQDGCCQQGSRPFKGNFGGTDGIVGARRHARVLYRQGRGARSDYQRAVAESAPPGSTAQRA